jgi:predicted Zn-dependent peptidase
MTIQPSSLSSHSVAAVQRFTLPNGLRVWIEPRPQTESVTVLAVLRAGSRYETLANNGISHFVEHMVFDGTEKWPTEEEVMDVITHRGGEWNGWTGEETTTYFVQLAQRHVEVAFDWLSQVVFHPIFPPDKVDKERDIIFQEKMGRYGWLINTLDRLGLGYELDRDVRRAVFPGSTLGLRIIGEDASLDRITRPALLDYYHAHYTPANSVLIVVGKVSVEEAYALAQKYFGALPSAAEIPPAPSTPPAARTWSAQRYGTRSIADRTKRADGGYAHDRVDASRSVGVGRAGGSPARRAAQRDPFSTRAGV